jgi:predicted amidophosphoribosyltransferase
MVGDGLVRDGAELALAVAVGGMLWSAIRRLRRGQARPVLCPGCGRAVSRVYDACPRCGHPTVG